MAHIASNLFYLFNANLNLEFLLALTALNRGLIWIDTKIFNFV